MPSYGPLLAPLDVIEVVSVCKTTDQIGLNILHYLVTAAGVGDVLSKIVDGLEGLVQPYSTTLAACMSASAEFRGYRVRKIFPAISVYYDDTRGAQVGGVAGDMLPRQVAGLVSKRVALPGRRMGGRAYIPFPGETDNDAASIPTAGYKTRLDAHAVNIGSTLAVGLTFNAQPCVCTIIYIAGVLTVVQSRTISQSVASQKWATQRRRGSYGRTNISPL